MRRSGTRYVQGLRESDEDCISGQVIPSGLAAKGSETILSEPEMTEDLLDEELMFAVVPENLSNEINPFPNEEIDTESVIHVISDSDKQGSSGEEAVYDDGDYTVDNVKEQTSLNVNSSPTLPIMERAKEKIKITESSSEDVNVVLDKVRKLVQVRKIITTSNKELDVKYLSTNKPLIFGSKTINSALRSESREARLLSNENSAKKFINVGCSGNEPSRDEVITIKLTKNGKNSKFMEDETSVVEKTNDDSLVAVKTYSDEALRQHKLIKMYCFKNLTKEMMSTLSEEEKKNTCPVCYKQFLFPKILHEHFRIHKIDNPFICEHCGQTFNVNHELKLHRRKHQVQFRRKVAPVHKCHHCNKTFREMYYLKLHSTVHTGEKRYTCDYCRRTFRLKMGLVKHIVVHADIQCWQCKECSRKFRFKSALKVHMLSHEKKKVPVSVSGEHATLTKTRLVGEQEKTTLKHCCEQCGKLFWKIQSLERHLQVHETENLPDETKKQLRENTLFGCVECGIAIFGRSNYYAHKRSHGPKNRTKRTPEELVEFKKFTCEFCDAKFRYPSDVIRHLRIHTGQRPYSCKVCGEQFAWSRTRDNHQMSHDSTEGSKYTCEICGKKSKNEFSFAKHAYIHTGQKPLICDYCSHGFITRSNFVRHLRAHERKIRKEEEQVEKEEIGYKLKILHDCDICGKYFTSRHIRNQHKLIHTGDKPFVCDRCPKSFNQKSNLTRHLQVHSRRAEEEKKKEKNCLTSFAKFRPGELNDCEFCKKKFKSKIMYDEHMYNHTGVRAFSCTVCVRSFSQRSNFWRHLKTHNKPNTDKDKWTRIGRDINIIQTKQSLQSKLDKLTESLAD